MKLFVVDFLRWYLLTGKKIDVTGVYFSWRSKMIVLIIILYPTPLPARSLSSHCFLALFLLSASVLHPSSTRVVNATYHHLQSER